MHINGRRADGLHKLQTIFHFIDWQDEISLVSTEDGVVKRARPIPGVKEEDDLCIRAAKLLQQQCGIRHGVEIAVNKTIPMGGGLGGGSSNAATVLVALNQLWGIGLTIEQLAELGLTLGADVPIFIYGSAAFAEGIGEVFEPVSLCPVWYLVAKPVAHVNTGEIFNDPALTRNSTMMTMDDFQHCESESKNNLDVLSILESTRNDCQPITTKRFPSVASVIKRMQTLGPTRMTGTGGCVFTAFESKQSVLEACVKWDDMRKVENSVGLDTTEENVEVRIVKGLNVSPLHRFLQ